MHLVTFWRWEIEKMSFIKSGHFLLLIKKIKILATLDPQSVADLSGVAGAPPSQKWRLQTPKMYYFWGLSVQKESPSTIWGGPNLLPILNVETLKKNRQLHFLKFFPSTSIRGVIHPCQESSNPVTTRFWPHIFQKVWKYSEIILLVVDFKFDALLWFEFPKTHATLLWKTFLPLLLLIF